MQGNEIIYYFNISALLNEIILKIQKERVIKYKELRVIMSWLLRKTFP